MGAACLRPKLEVSFFHALVQKSDKNNPRRKISLQSNIYIEGLLQEPLETYMHVAA